MLAGNRKRSFKDMRNEILECRYLRKNAQGYIVETAEQMFHCVARTVATVETKYGVTSSEESVLEDRFYDLMVKSVFLPNSPTLMNAGHDQENRMLSACFVLPIEDSIDGIFDTVKNTALIQKAGGGTGVSLDKLRPTGDIVKSTGGRTSGPISFLRVISETTNAIQQGAFRRGANMSMMSIEHPDILKYIHAKENLNNLTNFNLSVKVTDSFMQKMQTAPETVHTVANPRTKKKYVIPRSVPIGSYTIDELVAGDKAELEGYTVGEVWDMVVRNAHATGEPGICFIDRVNTCNPTPNLGQIEATNPCGEQPLLPYEACNLGSINVAKFINEERTDLNWESLAKTVKLAVRFLDNVIDASHWPVTEIREMTLGNRKIGLGIMGFADTLILLCIKYGGQKSVELAEKLASFVQQNAHQTSEELAKERGCFPNWKGSVWETKHHRPMRNAACTTIAPTGSISLIAGCSSGIEPIFSVASRRRALEGQEFVQLHPLLEELGTREGWLTGEIFDMLAQGVPPIETPEIPRKLAGVLETAHEVALEWHVRIQAAFQKYTDNAVSKTVNLPSNAIVEDVDKIYRLAFELGCKGITVYRDGCRNNQVITAAHKTTNSEMQKPALRDRIRTTTGATTKFRMGCGTLFVTVNKDIAGLCEVFANLGKAGCPAQSEATCRAISVALRCGVEPEVLIEQLKGIRCLSAISGRRGNKDIDVLSCPDAIARAIEESLGSPHTIMDTCTSNKCPDCTYPLRRESGCNICDNCGYSKCG